MTDPRRLLVVTHSQSGGTAAMTDALLAGAGDPAIDGVEVVWRDALTAGVDDVLASDAVVLGTPENFGYMSGALKHFFDRIYHPCLERTRGRPYVLFVKASHDGSGAVTSVQRIVTGLAWREILPPLVVVGRLDDDQLEAAHELGLTVAAGLEAGLW